MEVADLARRVKVSADESDFISTRTYHGSNAGALTQPESVRHRLVRLDSVLAALLFGVAILVRWPLIQRGETLLHPDEAVVGIMAQDIAAGERYPIYFYGQRYMGALEAYVIAAISTVVADPIHALRLGPACFFAALVMLQYLMLTRWFGRTGGLAGAAVLLASSPMFAQWSISARGGYIEVLLWGTGLLWAYSEWFARAAARMGARRKAIVGFLMGSGLWINPSILLFVIPIAVHAFFDRVLMRLLALPATARPLKRLASFFGRATLPILGFAGLVLVNCVWSVWVDDDRVRTMVLLDALPRSWAVALLGIASAVTIIILARHTALITEARRLLHSGGPIILGVMIGAFPCLVYVSQRVLGGRPLEPALPLGIRPLWRTGETMVYLLHGLPLLFGADPRPYIDHVTVGRDCALRPLDIVDAALVTSAWPVVAVAALTLEITFLFSHRRELSSVLALRPMNLPPAMMLFLGAAGTILMFLLSGCSCSFTTIRYMLPIWAFLPGLVASVIASNRFRAASRLGAISLCLSWVGGQWAFLEQIGNPHALRSLADTLIDREVRSATAEILDAHLLSFMTQQRCRVREFEPFWPRLAHYEWAGNAGQPIDYIVNTCEFDRTSDWTRIDSPGPPPPETQRTLWPRLRAAILGEPSQLIERETLPAGFERIRLRQPLKPIP